MNSTPARILFLSYYCHPQNLTATRNYYLSKFLAEAGHEVHIISKGVVNTEVSKKIKNYKVSALDYRAMLERLGVKEGVTSTVIPPGPWIQWGYKLLLRYPFNKWLGEGGGFYYLKAVKLALKLVRENKITHIFSSYRPMADLFIAEQIKIAFPQIIWIGDFRDVLWWEKTNVHYQETWIRALISRMDYISAVTKGIGRFWGEVFQWTFITLYNGIPQVPEQIKISDEERNKFTINYTGRIYTEFQQADILFQLLKELTVTDESFANDLCIRYSGISSKHWKGWMQKFGLLSYSRIENQTPVQQAWDAQARAHINLLLTWTTSDISGFIHGKFNEYLAARKPILCVIEGGADPELEEIYTPLTNSLLVYNAEIFKERTRDFILKNYILWKSTARVEELPESILRSYQWNETGKPLLNLITSTR